MQGERIVIGEIIRPHGVRGDVIVRPTGDDPGRFRPGTVLFREEEGAATLTVAASRSLEDGYLVLSDAPGLGCKLNPEVVEAHRAAGPSAVDSTKVVIAEK